MKRFIFLVILGLLLFPTVNAQVMRELNVTVDIQPEGSNDVQISFKFTDDIKEVNFPFSGGIGDLKSENGNCTVKKEIRNILNCKPPSPFIVGVIKITASFKGSGLTQKEGNITYFSFDIPILWMTDDVRVVVKLPEGMVLTKEVLLPISPSGVDMRYDGRRIMATWEFVDKTPGDVLPIRIYYEPLVPQPVIKYPIYELVAVISIIIIIGISIIYRKVSKRSEIVLSVLNEGERIVVDIIRREGKENVDQRKIVSASGFSKAKVSRIIQSLVSRGVVKSERIGRKNKVSLTKIPLKE